MPLKVRAKYVGSSNEFYRKGEVYELWLQDNAIMRVNFSAILSYMHTQHFLSEWQVLEILPAD